jgi:PDGLE domain
MKLFTVLALALAIGLATAIAPFASGAPDGPDRVAQDKAFVDTGRVAPVQESSPIPGYAFPGVQDERLATGLAGFAGTLIVFGAGLGLAAATRRRRHAAA